MPSTQRRTTLVLTNTIKVVGLVFAAREMLTGKDPVVLVLCGLMMSGAEGLERVLLGFFEGFFSKTKVE